MGVSAYLVNGKKKITIGLGRSYRIIPVGYSSDNINSKEFRAEVIKDLEKEIAGYVSDMIALVAYSPNNVEDLGTVKEEAHGILNEINESTQMLRMLYFINDAIEYDGFKLKIE